MSFHENAGAKFLLAPSQHQRAREPSSSWAMCSVFCVVVFTASHQLLKCLELHGIFIFSFNLTPGFSLILASSFLFLICFILLRYMYFYIAALSLLITQFSSVQSLSRVQLFATPWIAACQASLSITNSWSSPKLEVKCPPAICSAYLVTLWWWSDFSGKFF